VSLDTVVRFSDATFFLVAIPNLLGIYLLAKPLRQEISSYRKSVAAGEIKPVPEEDRVNLLDNGFPTSQLNKKEQLHDYGKSHRCAARRSSYPLPHGVLFR